jgi:hypothetical protein
VGAGVAAVAAEDRDLLLVGKDAKSPRVWEVSHAIGNIVFRFPSVACDIKCKRRSDIRLGSCSMAGVLRNVGAIPVVLCMLPVSAA